MTWRTDREFKTHIGHATVYHFRSTKKEDEKRSGTSFDHP